MDVETWTGGKLIGSGTIQGVQVDSRLVGQGDMFVCLVGERVNGHDYVQVALDNGAVALMVDHYLDGYDVPQIIVEDTLQGLRHMAKAYRNTLDAYFIAITGSNGKTSTKDILLSILSQLAPTVVTHKNQNTEIGTYLNIFRMDNNHRYGVFEMGLDKPGEVRLMSKFLEPDACIITSLAPTHIINFDSIDHLAREKFAIIEGVKNPLNVFYQGDYKLYRDMDKGYHTFGSMAHNETVYSDVRSSNDGIEFKINGIDYACNLLGEHQASNCAGIIALTTTMGIDDNVVRQGLLNVALTSLRTELIKKNNSLLIMDAYKSNPDSTRFALKLLKDYVYRGNRVAILSDMRELGDDSLQYHIDTLHEIKKNGIDTAYFLGPLFKEALNTGVLDSKMYKHFDSFETLYEAVQPLFEHQQLILIKGSRYYQLERLVKEV